MKRRERYALQKTQEESMNLYHAAALALIGWYPMAPPRESKTSGLHSGAAELSAAAIVAAAESMVGRSRR
jgi:hypothetical protein